MWPEGFLCGLLHSFVFDTIHYSIVVLVTVLLLYTTDFPVEKGVKN